MPETLTALLFTLTALLLFMALLALCTCTWGGLVVFFLSIGAAVFCGFGADKIAW